MIVSALLVQIALGSRDIYTGQSEGLKPLLLNCRLSLFIDDVKLGPKTAFKSLKSPKILGILPKMINISPHRIK